MILEIKKTLVLVALFFMSLFKKSDKKVVFESFSDFCDNSRALFEYMMKSGLNKHYKIIWCVDNPKKYNALGYENVIFTSFRNKKYLLQYLFHIATSKTVFYTHCRPAMIDTGCQNVVCLWHGIPLKRISIGGEPVTFYNFLPSTGDFYNDAMEECFGAKKNQLIVTGFPRNDLLFQQTDSLARLGIKKGTYSKVIMWMPTFRQHRVSSYSETPPTESGLPLLTDMDKLLECNARLNKNKQFLLLKLHPAQDTRCIEARDLSNIKILTNEDLDNKDIQLYHLLACCDALLTDYSSVYLDYLLLDRPIGFIIDDIVAYGENRGFMVDDPFSYMPGQQMQTLDELLSFLDSLLFDEDLFSSKRAWVCDQMHYFRDGNSSKRVAEQFLPPLKN